MKVEIYKIIRSQRKTIALLVDKNCNLIVKAPLSISIDYIEKIVEKKKNWIIEKKNELSLRKKLVRDFTDSCTIKIFDESYTIKYVENFEFAIKLKNNIIFIDIELKKQVRALLKLLIKKLRAFILNAKLPCGLIKCS
jgi:hypothetical protein